MSRTEPTTDLTLRALKVTTGDIDLTTGKLLLPQTNDATNPTINFGGDNGFYERDSTTIGISLNGLAYWQINTNYIGLEAPNYPVLRREASSATNPNLLPAYDDQDTGIGHAAADALSLIAGGVEGHRITEAAGAIDHVLTGVVKTPTTQTLTGAGAVDIVSAMTLIVTTAADALSLADGAEGQEKFIVMKTDAADGTLTPTNLKNGNTITFDDVGDSAHLIFMDGAWVWMGGTATLA